jgi:hypothetical protein
MTRAASCFLFSCSLALPSLSQSLDGIPIDWKAHGVTVTLPDGHTRFLDLPRLRRGSPQNRDLIVWINWMEAPDHSHSHKPVANTSKKPGDNGKALEQEPLNRVWAAFQKRGVNLILIYGDPLDEVPQIGGTTADGKYNWTDLDSLTRAHFPVAPEGIDHIVHLCTFIHQMSGGFLPYTGLSKTIPGREFLVSLGGSDNRIGTADSQSGTFMHELGHDLGLHHGGADDILRKPNYLSVMNYLFQVTGIMKDSTLGNFDYSDHPFNFDERLVDGRRGVTTDTSLANYGSAETCDPFFAKYRFFESVNQQLAWNCTANPPSFGPAPKDVNKDGSIQLLLGYHDWNSVVLYPFAPEAGEPTFTVPSVGDELPQERIAGLLAGLSSPKPTVGARPGGIEIRWERVPLASVVAYQVLRTRPGGRTDVIRQTKKTYFVDTAAQPGVTYSYQIRLVFNGPTAEEIDKLAESVRGVEKALAEDFRAAIPTKARVGEMLMLGQPSAPVTAAR